MSRSLAVSLMGRIFSRKAMIGMSAMALTSVTARGLLLSSVFPTLTRTVPPRVSVWMFDRAPVRDVLMLLCLSPGIEVWLP